MIFDFFLSNLNTQLVKVDGRNLIKPIHTDNPQTSATKNKIHLSLSTHSYCHPEERLSAAAEGYPHAIPQRISRTTSPPPSEGAGGRKQTPFLNLPKQSTEFLSP